MTTLQDGIQQVSAEAGGVLSVQIIRQCDVPALILDALTGSADAAQILRMVNDTVGRIQAAPRRKPALCGTCSRAVVGTAYSIVLARPDRDAPTQALATAICSACGPTYDAIHAKAIIALGRVWPDIRLIAVTHPDGGQA